MEFKYDGYCGLYCGACPVLLAHENGEVDKKAVEWNMKPEELICWGCRSEKTGVYCADCEMKLCAEAKKVVSCSACGDFPCERLVAFNNDKFPHHSAVLRNCENIRKQGVEGWIKDQQQRWSCPACGAKFAWYDETCLRCGGQVFNAAAEEKDLLKK